MFETPGALPLDTHISRHLFQLSRNKAHAALEYAYHNSTAKVLLNISCYPAQGRFLSVQALAKNILEEMTKQRTCIYVDNVANCGELATHTMLAIMHWSRI